MGYTITIGEREKSNIEDEEATGWPEFEAKSEEHPKAPAFGEPTDHSNSRWPSYTAWANAMRFVGLYDLFFNKNNGLMKNHPGCVPITAEHKAIIDKAYEAFYKKYPKCKAGFSPNSTDFQDDPHWPEENSYAVRLEWLKYWVDWSLKNCKNPVIFNS